MVSSRRRNRSATRFTVKTLGIVRCIRKSKFSIASRKYNASRSTGIRKPSRIQCVGFRTRNTGTVWTSACRPLDSDGAKVERGNRSEPCTSVYNAHCRVRGSPESNQLIVPHTDDHARPRRDALAKEVLTRCASRL
jgi:hypothetical protein